MRVDWCVSSWFRIKNTHSLTHNQCPTGEDWTGPEPDKGERITGQGPTGPAGQPITIETRAHERDRHSVTREGPSAQSLRDQRGPKGCRQRPSSRRTRLRLVVGSELHRELESLHPIAHLVLVAETWEVSSGSSWLGIRSRE